MSIFRYQISESKGGNIRDSTGENIPESHSENNRKYTRKQRRKHVRIRCRSIFMCWGLLEVNILLILLTFLNEASDPGDQFSPDGSFRSPSFWTQNGNFFHLDILGSSPDVFRSNPHICWLNPDVHSCAFLEPGPKTDVPGSNPDVNSSSPDLHGSKTDVPGPTTDMPGPTLDVPGSNTDVPGSNPDVPGLNPDVPGSNPDVPGLNPDVPRPKTNAPSSNPYAPSLKPHGTNWMFYVFFREFALGLKTTWAHCIDCGRLSCMYIFIY